MSASTSLLRRAPIVPDAPEPAPARERVRMRPDRRRWRRCPVDLAVRWMDCHGHEHDARLVSLSAGGARFAGSLPDAYVGPGAASVLRSIVCSVDGFGRLSGVIVRMDEGQFSVAFDHGPHKRERLVETLMMLLNKDRFALVQERRAARHAASGQTVVHFANGDALPCSVVDVSLLGVGLRVQGPRPPIGTLAQIGQHKGVVARWFEADGLAIDFGWAAGRSEDQIAQDIGSRLAE